MNIQEMQEPEERSRRRSPLIAVAVLLLVIGAAVASIWYFFLQDVQPPRGTSRGALYADRADTGEATTPVLDEREQKSGVYTVLIAGADKGEFRTDVLMLASVNLNTQKIHVLSIPRDTMVNGPQKGPSKKINAAYGRKLGIEATLEEVQKLTGIEVNRYAVTSFDGFIRIVDAIGGIDYNVPIDMYHADGKYTINLKKGQKTLTGEEALQVVRFRDRYLADLGRIGRTQDFLSAVAKQLLAERNVLNLAEVAKVLLEETETDLTMGELTWLASRTLGLDSENITFMTLPGQSRTVSGISFYIPDAEGIVSAVNEFFNPYKTDLTAEDFNIVAAPYRAY